MGTAPALLGRPHVVLDLCLEEGGEKDGRTLQAEAAVLLRLSQRVRGGRHLQSTNVVYVFTSYEQCCGSLSAWIRIKWKGRIRIWIRIRI